MTDAEESRAEPDTDVLPVDIVAEVAAHDEELAEEVGDLLDRIDELESELESTKADLETTTERLEHTRADFRNYKNRAKRRREEVKERATEELVERLLDVRDNLSRALEEESGDVDSLREGVKLTRKQFDRVLDGENVDRIEPEPGSDVDANRHEVVHRVESDQPADTIASVYRPGYEMAGKVLRPAQVTVSEATGEEETVDERKEATDEEETIEEQETLEEEEPAEKAEAADVEEVDDADRSDVDAEE